MATGKANNVGLPLEDGEAIQAGQYQLQDDDQIIEQVVEDSEEESHAEEEGNREVERVEDTEDEEVGEVERVEDTEDEENGEDEEVGEVERVEDTEDEEVEEVERVEDTEDEENGEDEWVEDTEDEGGEVERVEDTEDEEDSEEDTMKKDGHNYTGKKEESGKEEQVKRDDGTAVEEEEDEQVKKDNRNIQEDKDQSSEEEKEEEEEEEEDIDGEEDEQVFDNEEEEEKVDEKTTKKQEESDDGEEEEDGEGEESEEEKQVKVDGERINLEDESAEQEEEEEKEEEEEAAAELPRKDGPIFLASKVNSKRKRVVADPQCSKKQRLLVTSVIGSRLSNPISLKSNLKDVQSCCISRKRSRENEDAVMKRRDNGDGDQKKTNKEVLVAIGRRFTPEEEIALLEGMIDYVTMKGRNPKSNVRAFHKFMIQRHDLSSDISAKQLKNKMCRLCKKHKAIKENNKESRKKGRRVNSMTQHHQGRVLELLNKFWEIRTSPTPKRMMAATADPSARGGYSVVVDALLDFIHNTNCNVTAAGGGGGGGKAEAEVVIDEQFLKQGLEMVSEDEREALEERWKKLRRKELGIKLERASLAHDSAMAILHAISD